MYNYITKHFLIPAIGPGETINAVDERIKANIVDTQLWGAFSAHSGGHGIIADGIWASSFSTNDSSVTLSPTAEGYAVKAFINQMYVIAGADLLWEDMLDNTTYYLYIVRTETSAQTGNTVAVKNTTGVTPENGLLIATATTTAVDLTLDTAPSGRIDIPTIAGHAGDTTDPHGATLYQTSMLAGAVEVSGQTQFSQAYLSGLTVNNLTVVDAASFYGGMVIQGNLGVSGITQIAGTALIESGLYATGSITAANVYTSGLTVAGISQFKSHIVMGSGITIDGWDPSFSNANLTSHTGNTSNPHQVTASQAGALPTAGGTMTGNINFGSGISVDGIDPTTLIPLIDGSYTTLHEHRSGVEYIHSIPRYQGEVYSGVPSEYPNLLLDDQHYAYSFYHDGPGGDEVLMLHPFPIPYDFSSWVDPGLQIFTKVTSGAGHVDVDILDTTGSAVSSTSVSGLGLIGLSWTQTDINVETGTFEPGQIAALRIRLATTSGVTAYLGEGLFRYART